MVELDGRESGAYRTSDAADDEGNMTMMGYLSSKVLAAIAAVSLTAACVAEDLDPTSATTESEIVSAQPEDFAIFVPGSSSCLDVANYSTVNGGPVHQWSCHYDANQLWRFTAVGSPGEAVYAITSRLSGLVLDVSGVSTAPGAHLHQWSYVGGGNQKFRVIHVDGKVQLQATHSGLCVSIAQSGTPAEYALGTLFRQYPCNAADWRQLFQIQRRGKLAKKALVVLIQNGGYDGGLPFNPGFDIAVGLRFSCGGWNVDLDFGANVFDAIARAGVPPFNACLNPNNWSVSTRTRHYTASEFVRETTNFAAAQLGVETVYASGAANRYDTIRILKDGDLRVSRIRQELQSLAASYIVDLHVLAHGDESGFGLNGEVTASDLRNLRTIVGLHLRSVFQQNCNGSGLNAAWITGGARVVTGSAGINSMPFAYKPFIDRWVQGETFAEAVQHSYDDVAPMHDAAYRFIDVYDEGAEQERNPAEYSLTGQLSPDDELAGSSQIVQGNGSLRL